MQILAESSWLNEAPQLGLIVALLAFIHNLGATKRRVRKAEIRLHEWSTSEKYRLIQYRVCAKSESPMRGWMSDGQILFRITVQTLDGKSLQGWVRFGSLLGGLHSRAVRVVWENDKGPRAFPVIMRNSPENEAGL